MSIDPELAERFRADCRAIVGPTDERKLGIAYSGGPDSLALLLLAHAAFPGHVEAATVDHGLRSESGDEAALAASNCRALGVPHEILTITVAPGNMQSEARRARYAALGRWCEHRGIDDLYTAHHADDQVETFLMRANRGSGWSGLAGVRPLGSLPDPAIRLVRPLLGWRRAELERIVESSGFEAVDDPSNRDERFDRVRMRKALARSDFIDVPGVSRSSALLAELEADIAALVREERARAMADAEGGCHYRPFGCSKAERPVIWAEVVTSICNDLGSDPTRSQAALMVEELRHGRAVNVAGIQARPSGGEGDTLWSFAPENRRRTG